MTRSSVKTLWALQAIIFREIKSRYSGDPIGYIWVYTTPLAWLAVIYAGFVFLNRQAPVDTDTISFILSGILPYMGFRFGVTAMIRTRSSYRQLMLMTGTNPNLIYIGVAILETCNVLALYACMIFLNALFTGNFDIHNLSQAIMALILSCLLGYALGYCVCAFSQKTEIFIRMTPVILRPTLFVSGVFYTANELPQILVSILSVNPLFHIIEFLRTGLFLGYQSPVQFILYPVALIGGMLWVGAHRFRTA